MDIKSKISQSTILKIFRCEMELYRENFDSYWVRKTEAKVWRFKVGRTLNYETMRQFPIIAKSTNKIQKLDLNFGG